LDIFPTIFEILDFEGPKNPINGQSLVPLLNNDNFKSLPAYMESAVIKKSPTKNPNPAVGIRTNDYKYFRDLNNAEKNVHLYDLNQDPLEDYNIANINPEKIKEFEIMLLEIRNNATVEENTENLSNDEEKELEAELKKLGYI
jgi:arylsulfatase A-like enzyme